MTSSREDRERLLRIISLCLSVEKTGGNPFEVEVREVLETLKKHLPHWKALEDFVLDAETLNRISSVVRLQGNWIKHRSTTLFVDPLLIELKIKVLGPQSLANIFRKSWHPIVEMDKLSKRRVTEAVGYWNQLLSIEERLMKLPEASSNLGLTSIEELIKSRIISEESFNDLLQRLWSELKAKAVVGGRIPYWDFIYAPTYDETVFRAYLTSFLLTYGFASMEVDPVGEKAFLIPRTKPKEVSLKEQMVSLPISIDYDTWKEMTGGKES